PPHEARPLRHSWAWPPDFRVQYLSSMRRMCPSVRPAFSTLWTIASFQTHVEDPHERVLEGQLVRVSRHPDRVQRIVRGGRERERARGEQADSQPGEQGPCLHESSSLSAIFVRPRITAPGGLC